MRGFLIRVAVGALGLWLAGAIIPGIHLDDQWTLLFAALLLGVANAIVRPVVIFLTLPITVITLGLFLLVINAGMLGLVAWFLDGFSIDGFFSALFGAIIVSLVSWIASWTIGPEGRYEVLVVRKRIEPPPPL